MKMLDVPQSGSIGGVTSSHNRFGQYKRARSIPVNPRTVQQGSVRARQTNSSQLWKTLTDAQRAAWGSVGSMITRTDALGQSYNFNGFMAFCSVNNNREATGLSPVTAAPVIADPGSLLTATITLTSASLSIAFTATPLGAATYLLLFASPQRSAGRAFEGDYRLIAVSAAAQATPFVALTSYTSKFGSPVTGNRIFFSLQLSNTGFLGSPLNVSQIVA